MALPDELIRLIKAEVARQLTHADRLKIGCIEGKGGNTVITSNGDILLRTLAGKKAYYNGTEIGTTSGTIGGSGTSPYLAKFTAGSTISNSIIKADASTATIEGSLSLYKSGGSNYVLTFQHPTGGSAQKAYMNLFSGYTVYDFLIHSNGRLQLEGTNGVYIASPLQALTMAGAIAMSGYNITGAGDIYLNKVHPRITLTNNEVSGGSAYIQMDDYAGLTIANNHDGANSFIRFGSGTDFSLVVGVAYVSTKGLEVDGIAASLTTSNIGTVTIPFQDMWCKNMYVTGSAGTGQSHLVGYALSIDTTSGLDIILNPYTSLVRSWADLLPYTDNAYDCGNNDKRWYLVRGVTITPGDLGFEESSCAICQKPFSVGDVLALQVVEIGDKDAPIRTVPIHANHKSGDKFNWVKKPKATRIEKNIIL